MSPNTTPSAPTISAALALLWCVGWWAASVTDDGLVLSEAIRSNAAQGGGGATVCAPAFRLSTRQYGVQLRRKRLTWRGDTGGLGAWLHPLPCMPRPMPMSAIRGSIARIRWREHFAAMRRDDPVHRHRRQPLRALLVGDALRRHHEGRARSRDLFLGLGNGRHPDRRPAQGPGAAQLHPHGPAAPHRAAQDRGADRGADQPRQHGRPDPRAHGGGARRPAAQRDLRLGRSRLDRAHGADAGDAVRLPAGRAAQAHLVVRRRHRQHRGRGRRGEERGRAHGRAHEDGRDHGRAVEGARRGSRPSST